MILELFDVSSQFADSDSYVTFLVQILPESLRIIGNYLDYYAFCLMLQFFYISNIFIHDVFT